MKTMISILVSFVFLTVVVAMIGCNREREEDFVVLDSSSVKALSEVTEEHGFAVMWGKVGMLPRVGDNLIMIGIYKNDPALVTLPEARKKVRHFFTTFLQAASKSLVGQAVEDPRKTISFTVVFQDFRTVEQLTNLVNEVSVVGSRNIVIYKTFDPVKYTSVTLKEESLDDFLGADAFRDSPPDETD